MEKLESIEALVHLEDEMPDVLFESVAEQDIHVWPLIRVALGLRGTNKELGSSARRAGVRAGWSRSDTIRHLWTLAVPNRFHSSHAPRNREILVVAGGGTSRPTPNGRENWLVDDFARSMDGKALVLQDGAIPIRPELDARPAFPATLTLRDAYLRVLVKSKLGPLPERTEAHIRRVVREILKHYDHEVDESLAVALEGVAVQQVRRSSHWRTEFERILGRTAPSLVVLDNASYMTKAAVTKTIRRYGIHISEPQHGWIGPSHAAYNYGRAFFEPELKQYLPDSVLTFGDFWSRGIRHPGELVSVGKPYLEKASTAANRSQIRQEVLVTSSIYRTEELVRLCLSLRDELPNNMTVVVRPHPSERPRAEALFSDLANQERMRLDLESDVYESFARSTAVIGYASTVLFEALAFGIPVFVIDSPLADLYTPTAVFGQRISPDGPLGDVAEQVAKYVPSNRTSSPDLESIDQIWKQNSVENFKQFVGSVRSKPANS